MKLQPMIDFGKQPKHANGYMMPKDFGNEEFYYMVIGYDEETHAIRLQDVCDRSIMFNDQYAFYSKTSSRMIDHFKTTAEKLKKYVGTGIVVEVGSNDGIMLDAWRDMRVTCVGVDPSGNVAEIARKEGHEVITDFISVKVAEDILEKHKHVDLVYAANTSCHITDFDEYLESVKKLIGNTGVFVFEDPYFLDVWKLCSYDQFYGEHTWMFTVKFIEQKMKEHGLTLFDIEHLWTHGGSMRFYCTYNRLMAREYNKIEEQKKVEGDIHAKLIDLKERVVISRESYRNLVESLQGKKFCAFGATSKGVVVTNYCGLDASMIPFITDTTPTKIGKYYPGTHIPIRSQAETDYSEMEYMLLFAWNHFEEIKNLKLGFKGKWILHTPYPRIVS